MMVSAACTGRQQTPACPQNSAVARSQRAQLAFSHRQQRLQRRHPAALRRRLVVSATLTYGADWSTPKDAYLTVGLSHCYVKGDDGLVDQYVIEPITANSLECMDKGARTSFKHVFGLRLADALQRSKSAYPAQFGEAAFCEDYESRCDACARTWMRPHAMDNLLDIVPLGQLRSNFNYSTTDKRVLNAEHIVDDDDNIKQDLSIDVYGRKSKEDAAAALAGSAPAAPQEAAGEEDDMDALLSV